MSVVSFTIYGQKDGMFSLGWTQISSTYQIIFKIVKIKSKVSKIKVLDSNAHEIV